VLAVVIGALALLAFVLIRLAGEEYSRHGRLSTSTSMFGWALYVLHGLTTVLVAAAGLGRLDVPAGPAVAVGLLTVLAGLGLGGAGAAALGSVGPLLGREPQRLVTSGVYAITRHPQSIGWALVLVGAAIAGRSGLALALALGFAVAVAAYLPTEERHLRDRHGEAYDGYRRQTRVVGRA
jgi:protein-S-isoprenylcysteine O-methyltransferase Ste14